MRFEAKEITAHTHFKLCSIIELDFICLFKWLPWSLQLHVEAQSSPDGIRLKQNIFVTVQFLVKFDYNHVKFYYYSILF